MVRGRRKETTADRSQAHAQFSVRVARDVLDGLSRRAHELGVARNGLAERYLAEGVRMDEHPEIYFREGALGRRAALVGTRLDVWQVIETLKHAHNSIEEAAEYLALPKAKVEAAVRYYARYLNEVDDIAARERSVAERAEETWRAAEEILA